MKVIAPGDVEIELGELEAAPTIGIIDYSRRDTDDFGVTKVVERGFARRMSVRISLPTDSVDAVQRSLADLRAVPAQWVADEAFAWLNFEGFYKDFALDLAIPPVSFCSLTVEGLAETETVADTGLDPAPVGTASSLLLLQPVTITGAMLAASNVAETDYPEWSALTTYPAAARVILAATHRIYESVAAGNLNNNPAGESGLWFDVGPTNRWAMFDQALGTVTSRSDSIAVTLAAGTVNAVGLLDVVGATVRVQTTGYDETKAVAGGSVNFLDIPGLDDDVMVTISGTGTVSAGTLVIGTLVALGVTEESPTAGITDFSRKEVDDFGEATIVPRAWAKRMSAAALISTDAVDVVANRIAAVRARPSLWIADDGTDSLTLYGFFKDFSIEIGETVSKLGLTLEGLSEAMPFGADFQGLSIIEKTVYQRAASAPATPTGGSYDFSTRTTTPPSGWGATLPSGTDSAWASTATAAKEGMGGSAPFGDWSEAVVAFANGVDGTDGLDGEDGKLVEFIWRRAGSIPATPTGDGIPSGWFDEPPAGLTPLWMSKAKQELTGVLVSGETWSTPIRHDGPAGLDGNDGIDGDDGKLIEFVWKRAASLPTTPTGNGIPAGWSDDPPSGTDPLWMSKAKQELTGVLVSGESWSTPIRHDGPQGAAGAPGTDGAPGTNGADGITYYTWYAYADAPDGTFNFTTGSPGSRVYQGIATGKTSATESTDPADYVWSQYVGPPNFGLAAFNTNTVVAANKLIKVAGGVAWNASIHSTESYKGGASVSFVVDLADQFMVGLNTDPTTDAGYVSIDFAIYITNSSVAIYENGAAVATGFPVPVVGDVFTVTYNGKSVIYSKNGTAFYTNSSPPPNLTLFLDSSLAIPGHFGRILSFSGVGQAGIDGANGYNNAVVYLYQRSATSPAAPSGTFTYTFTTGILSGGTPGSWSQVIPAANGNPLWVIAATASATTATDSIPAAEFTSPILKDGAGLNAATVFLYQRAASAPSAPGASTTYTFSTGVLSGTLGSWTQTVPAFSANPLYVITATALAAGATDTIASGEWSAVRVLAENGADGSPGTPGVSPVNALAVPANKQFTADSDGTIKAGQLPFNVAIDGYKAGATISGTVSILAVSGCTATAISGGFTIDTVFADAGFVTWRFTASDGQVVDNKMSFSRQRDPASGGQVSINFSSTSWWGSGSYGATGPSTVLPASSTGKLAIAGYASFYCSGNGEARLTAKLQYRAVGSGTWLDSGFTSGPSIALKTPDFPGEPGENSPGEVSPGGTLTGLTANGSYEVQMVGSRNASYNAIASATGFITLRQVL